MAESTLSVDLQELRKHAAYFSGYQRPFSEGTVTITVLGDGSKILFDSDPKYLLRWPSWSAGATFIYDGDKYKVHALQLPPRSSKGTRNYTDNYWLVTEAQVYPTALAEKTYELVPWDDRQFEDIDSAVEGGLRRFYYPYIESEGQIYQWSFLRKEATTGAVSASDSSVALADDVAHIVDDSVVVHTVAGAYQTPLTRVTETEIRKLRTDPKTGAPKYYAVRATHGGSTATAGQRFEIAFYPNADAAYQFSYTYVMAPDKLSTTNKYPLGGALHSQTLIEAVLAECEKNMDDQSGVHEAMFQKLLISSYRADLESKEGQVESSYNVTAPEYGTYQWYQQECGLYMEMGANPDSFTVGDGRTIDSIIQSGYKQFCFPPTMEGQKEPHKWSFLCPTDTIQLVDGSVEYDLPSDFGQVLGEFTWPVGTTGSTRIPLVSQEKILQLIATENAGGKPKWAAVKPVAAAGTSRQAWKLLLYPKPGSAEGGALLSYRYLKVPGVISATNLHPAGGDVHAETILASCLSIAEIRKNNQTGPYEELFQSRLSASIQVDMQSGAVTEDNTYADTEPTFGTNQYFKQEVGIKMNFGANFHTWSQSEVREIGSIVTRGYKQFSSPPPLPGEGNVAHEGSFMAPEGTAVVWGDTKYTYTGNINGGYTINVAAGQTFYDSMIGKKMKVTTLHAVDETAGSDTEYTILSIANDVITVKEQLNEGTTVGGTLTIIADGDYELSADHGGFVGSEIFYDDSDNASTSIRLASASRILEQRQYNVGSSSPVSRPTDGAYRPKKSDNTESHRAILMVWPIPDGTYTLHYQYHAIQSPLTDEKNYPLGSTTHAETILASCLAVAEMKLTGQEGPERNNFIRLLMASVSRDRNAFRPRVFGVNRDNSDGAGGQAGRWYTAAKYFDGTTYHGGDS